MQVSRKVRACTLEEDDILLRNISLMNFDDEQITLIESKLVSFFKSQGIFKVMPTSDDIYNNPTLKKKSDSLKLKSQVSGSMIAKRRGFNLKSFKSELITDANSFSLSVKRNHPEEK